MKKGLKKRLLTGIAAVALVAPLVLSGVGINHVHAAQTAVAPQVTTSTNNQSSGSSNSSQLAAIKSQIQAQEGSMQNTLKQAQQKYKSIPKNDKSQQKAFVTQYEKQQKPAQQKLVALQKQYVNTMTPEQRKQAQQKQQAAQKQLMQQIQKQMKAQQKKEQVKMLKTAQTIFVIQGKRVYTLRTDVTKNKKGQEQLQPIPGINKKYYSSLRAFGKKQATEIQRARLIAYNAKRFRNKATRRKALKKAQNLFMQYARVANIPTEKQQKAEAKKMAKQQKNQRSVANSKSHKSIKRNLRSHKRNRSSVRKNYRKIRNRIKRSKRGIRHIRRTRRNTNSFSVKEYGHRVTLLRSEFKRGNYQSAKRSGFVRGNSFPNGLSTMFDRYRPNNRRAVIPKNYKIYKVNINNKNRNQKATVWLVGRRNNNIDNMKQAYYYGYNNNKHYGGWRNIGA